MENQDNEAIIQDLLEQFEFSELTTEQKELVLKYSSEEEYNELRQTIIHTIDYFKEQPKLYANKRLIYKIERTSNLGRILSYNIPLYKVAAIVVIVLVVDALLDNSLRNTNSIELTENLVVDTTTAPVDNNFIQEIEQVKKYSSHNSIKYNTGLAKGY